MTRRMVQFLRMEIEIRRFDKTLPLPEYQTPGAVAMDCVSRIDADIPARTVGYVPLNIALKPPPGHLVMMAARSSLHKRGLILANGMSLFDEDFSGDADEYIAILYNFTDAAVRVGRGERITQVLALPYERVQWHETEHLGNSARGGIGSTGV